MTDGKPPSERFPPFTETLGYARIYLATVPPTSWMTRVMYDPEHQREPS